MADALAKCVTIVGTGEIRSGCTRIRASHVRRSSIIVLLTQVLSERRVEKDLSVSVDVTGSVLRIVIIFMMISNGPVESRALKVWSASHLLGGTTCAARFSPQPLPLEMIEHPKIS